MSPEAALCLHCGYFMLEYEPAVAYVQGYYEVTGWGERWVPTHRVEPFMMEEYVTGSESRDLWSRVWDRAWPNDTEKDEPYVFFDYLYFGM